MLASDIRVSQIELTEDICPVLLIGLLSAPHREVCRSGSWLKSLSHGIAGYASQRSPSAQCISIPEDRKPSQG
jgi:hypothetical protein